MPPGAINVARPGPWGNPYRVFQQKAGTAPGWYVQRQNSTRSDGPMTRTMAENLALAKFRQHAHERRNEIRKGLRGLDLACWCKLPDHGPDRCHRAILLEVANATD